jgi:hypothetical protein
MTISSAEQELIAVNAAIEAILSGAQSYQINNQSVTRANLDSLFKRKDYLESRIAAKQRGGNFKKKPVFEEW